MSYEIKILTHLRKLDPHKYHNIEQIEGVNQPYKDDIAYKKCIEKLDIIGLIETKKGTGTKSAIISKAAKSSTVYRSEYYIPVQARITKKGNSYWASSRFALFIYCKWVSKVPIPQPKKNSLNDATSISNIIQVIASIIGIITFLFAC